MKTAVLLCVAGDNDALNILLQRQDFGIWILFFKTTRHKLSLTEK